MSGGRCQAAASSAVGASPSAASPGWEAWSGGLIRAGARVRVLRTGAECRPQARQVTGGQPERRATDSIEPERHDHHIAFRVAADPHGPVVSAYIFEQAAHGGHWPQLAHASIVRRDAVHRNPIEPAIGG